MDPFSKKDWYEIKAPSMFQVRNVGKTLVTRTTGTKVRRMHHTACIGGLKRLYGCCMRLLAATAAAHHPGITTHLLLTDRL